MYIVGQTGTEVHRHYTACIINLQKGGCKYIYLYLHLLSEFAKSVTAPKKIQNLFGYLLAYFVFFRRRHLPSKVSNDVLRLGLLHVCCDIVQGRGWGVFLLL